MGRRERSHEQARPSRRGSEHLEPLAACTNHSDSEVVPDLTKLLADTPRHHSHKKMYYLHDTYCCTQPMGKRHCVRGSVLTVP